MPGPWKPFDPLDVGRHTQAYKSFAQSLFNDANYTFREQFRKFGNNYNGNAQPGDEVKLRDALNTALGTPPPYNVPPYNINNLSPIIPPKSASGKTLRIIVVDVERADLYWTGNDINFQQDDFYLFFMPPIPRNGATAEYKTMQAWESAWHHSIVDGYGM